MSQAVGKESSGWVDVHGAAAHLKMTEGAVRQACARRQLPFVRLGRRLRFRVADLDAHLQAGRVEPIDESKD